MFYIPQIQKDDCGFACLKMVLANLNKDKNYLFLPQDEKHGRYSFSDLMDIAETHGLTFTAFKLPEKSELGNSPKFPLIASIGLKNGAKHAVVVTKVKWKRVTYLDPSVGKVTVSLKKFIEIWDGTGLMVENHRKTICPIKDIEPISFAKKFALGLVQLLSGAFVILGVYFIKDDTPIYMPLIFLSLALLSESLMKLLSYSYMKQIDSFFFRDENVPKSGFRDYLARFENYKKLSLSSPMNYILTLVFSLGLAMVVMLNDYRNLMIVVVPVVIALFEGIIIFPILKKKRHEIEELEDGIDEAKDARDFQEKAKGLHQNAYRYSCIDLFKRYCFALLMLSSVLLTMRLCEISSLPYIIFYTCISVALYKSCNELFSFSSKIEEFNKVKVKISNSLKSIK